MLVAGTLTAELRATPRSATYTANQPLCMGGQLYMWNRYWNVGHLVHMTEAQFTKGGHQSRVELVTPDGKKQWLILPLVDRHLRPIDQCMVHEAGRTLRKVTGTLDALYGRFEHYRSRRGSLRDYLAYVLRAGVDLATLNVAVFQWLYRELRLSLEQHLSRELVPGRPEDPSEWVAAMGAAISCSLYVGGGTAQRAYLRDEHFSSRNMAFVAQDFRMRPYRRPNGDEWGDASVCVLDPLFVGGLDLVAELVSVPAW
jgi:hypothetical protein